MSDRVGVPARVRRVSSELRELRLRNGLGAEEVSSALGMSMSKLSRMETGQRGLQVDDVAALLGLYRVRAERRVELLGLVREATKPNWWRVGDRRLAQLDELVAFESSASAFRNYETILIPGLVQTPEYMVAVAEAAGRGYTADEVDRLVRAKADRQNILRTRPHQQFEFVIEQHALERGTGGPGVMYRQLRHLSSTLSRENVDIRVLPAELGAHAGMAGSFVILEFETHQDLVYFENRGASAYLEESRYITDAKEVLVNLRNLALSPRESAALITEFADRMA